MARNVVFDEASAERIARAVKWVESQALDESPDPTPLPTDETETTATEYVEAVTAVEAAGNLTLLSAINPTGQIVTGVECVDGNLTVTTADLSEKIEYTEQTVRLQDLATVTTQNLALPPQTGGS